MVETDDSHGDDDHNISHGDDHSASTSGHIFGAGTESSGLKLFIGFCICCLYLIGMGKFLDSMEKVTCDTPYHHMLHNIYREIMMVGIGLFVFTILHETGYELPFDFYYTYSFVDICCFVMAIFFCIQGVFVMFGSVRQVAAWQLASKIPTEELQLQVNVTIKNSPILWKLRYFQFCPVRDYVEFRVLHSIFSSVYSITTRSGEFDFGMYLQRIHEKNILSLTHISPAKWFVILFLTALISLKLTLMEPYCEHAGCNSREDVWIFTIGGFISSFFALILMYFGRLSEIRLLNIAGVESIADYTIFLMTEVKTRAALQSLMLDKATIEECLVEINEEFNTKRITDEMKKKIHQLDSYSRWRTTFVGFIFGETPAAELTGQEVINLREESPYYIKEEDNENEQIHDNKDPEVLDNGETKVLEISKYTTPKIYPEEAKIHPESFEVTNVHAFGVIETPSTHKLGKDYSDPPDHEPVSDQQDPPKQLDSQVSQQEPLPSLDDESHARRASRRKDVSVLVKVRSRRRSLFTKASSKYENSSESPAGDQFIKKSNSSFRCSWRQSMKDFFTPSNSGGVSNTLQRKKNLKEKLIQNHNKQNYEDVFPFFNNPPLYYWLVDFSFTCNSLYLAWWSLNFVFLASSQEIAHHHSLDRYYLPILSLIPAIISFISLTFAIRSTSLLRAMTKIQIETLLEVMKSSQSKALLLDDLREKLLNGMKAEETYVTRPLLETMLNVCRRYYSVPHFCGAVISWLPKLVLQKD